MAAPPVFTDINPCLDPDMTSSLETVLTATQTDCPTNERQLLHTYIQDRRKEMAKTVSKLSEDGKVSIRNVRRDAMKQASKLEKDKSISEDELADLEKAIQDLTDDYVKQARSCVGGCVTVRQSARDAWPASAQRLPRSVACCLLATR